MKKTPGPSHLRTHRKCVRLWTIFVLLALLVPTALIAENRQIRASAIRVAATIHFSGHYRISCNPSLVEQALDHPLLLGMLWSSYGYAPAYKVASLNEPGAFHIHDPTGIVGNIWLVSVDGARRVYLAEGMLDHWAVLLLNAGTAVFEVEIRPEHAGTIIGVDVFIKPESRLAGAILWAVSPVLKARIQNRISLNLQDVASILNDVDRAPEKVFTLLPEENHQEFKLTFNR